MTIPAQTQPLHMNIHDPLSSNMNTAPQVIAGYTLQERLGSGSFATVFRGVKVVQVQQGHGHDDGSTSTGTSTPTQNPMQNPTQNPTQEQTSTSTSTTSTTTSTSTTTTTSTTKLETVAIKAISRTSDKLTKKVLENLELEISILQSYRHPHIVSLQSVQKTNDYIYLLLEYCAGGDVQHLIRSRSTGRLSEGLTRRLMRDLTSGLQFLWRQNLIHRDIKPQNLLLTGPLPLDEVNDGSKNVKEEEERRRADFPSELFHLKIADFGFARHLQKTSMADTLCGSPLYMAPEILQHRRYDSKADLWSAGTVLFEMIAGRPPFHGENHIDLLRNIQQKAVRLPPNVKISPECVKLLRLLLNRNPLNRAGFQEFSEASDAFVALGCLGTPLKENSSNTSTLDKSGIGTGAGTSQDGSMWQPNSTPLNLGPISEVEESHHLESTSTHASLVDGTKGKANVNANVNTHAPNVTTTHAGAGSNTNSPHTISPASTNGGHPVPPPFENRPIHMVSPTPTADPNPTSHHYHQQQQQQQEQHRQQQPMSHAMPGVAQTSQSFFKPLEPSPPGPQQVQDHNTAVPPLFLNRDDDRSIGLQNAPTLPSLHPLNQNHHQQQQQQQSQQQHMLSRRPDSSQHSDDSGFVMVERGAMKSYGSNPNAAAVPNTNNDIRRSQSPGPRNASLRTWTQNSLRQVVPASALISSSKTPTSPPSSPGTKKPSKYFSNKSIFARSLPRGLPFGAGASKGMLSTSPGTGGALVGMMGATSPPNTTGTSTVQLAAGRFFGSGRTSDVEMLSKMLAAADDVGRRAVNVAHVGDTRAYLAMKLIMSSENGVSSSLSVAPMEGVEEESHAGGGGENVSTRSESASDNSSFSTYLSRTRAMSHDRSALTRVSKQSIKEQEDEEEEEEMPFAMASPSNDSSAMSTDIFPRVGSSTNLKKSAKAVVSKANIQTHFHEALSCYIKALSMLKSSISASQRVLKELKSLSMTASNNVASGSNSISQFKQRCEVSYTWLTGQFKGVLERADAANSEISQLKSKTNQEGGEGQQPNAVSQEMKGSAVEELIYNHSRACGRDGAVKQLLGQYEAARSCYRSAGLLAETLLMEPKLEEDDRKTLEEYVLGFSERITEVDTIMLGQSVGGSGASIIPAGSSTATAGMGSRVTQYEKKSPADITMSRY